jgi:hypothetical protein
VRAAGFRLIRYADDFVILTERQLEAQAADALVRHVLADMGLQVTEPSPAKRRQARALSSSASASSGGTFGHDQKP